MGFILSLFRALVAFAFKDSLKFIALKGFLTMLILVMLPIVLNNLMGKVFKLVADKVATMLPDSTGITELVYSFTGLTAFFIHHLQIKESISLVLSAIAIRVTLSMIPFTNKL